jgi:single-strand DNA-binding protein
MAGSLNKVVLIGNLGQDPEIRLTNDGRELANFSIATNETWIDKATGDKKERTEWHRIVVFNEGLVRVIKNYVKKGSKLYIEGQLRTRKWIDEGSQERYMTEIVLQNYNSTLIILDSRGNLGSNGFNNNDASNNINDVNNNIISGNDIEFTSKDDDDLNNKIPF